MIDYEVKIFNLVHGKVASLCANKKFVSTVIATKPTAFPAASLIEIGNITSRSRQTNSQTEDFVLVQYQLDVYATSKSDCKKVVAAADNEMISMNFIRISGDYINNWGNPNVFRYTARYEAEIDKDGNIFRP